MRKWFGLLGVASVVFVAAVPSFAGHCCKHHHGCCCCQESQSRDVPRAPFAPRAAVVDSMPVFQMTPGVVAMPMMMAGFARSLPEQPRSAPQECDNACQRIDQLEQKVDALDLRMQTIMRSVEIQTRILEEMKAEKMFPKRYLQDGAEKAE